MMVKTDFHNKGQLCVLVNGTPRSYLAYNFWMVALETNKTARVIVNLATQRESRSKRECGGGRKERKEGADLRFQSSVSRVSSLMPDSRSLFLKVL